ncbi:TadE/TadG family type IV pilus assembly protein [Actibacterium sp.]|uniref:TadE/TadG family type IV pilus assembly protein n=1 Tax=Actibacterium sp. TaxID=1872125 RepID=UPI0035673C58
MFGVSWSNLKSARRQNWRRAAVNRAKGFGQDETGSILIFALCMLILMIWSGGIAIDVMRVEAKRTHLQNTLDRAVLAAADLTQSEDAKLVVTDYFDKAGLANYLTSVVVTGPTSGEDLAYRKVAATAKIPVDSMFMHLLGVDTLNATASGAAEEGITDLEISLIVDVSGSMGQISTSGKSKLYELQEAAKDFGWHMLCNPSTSYLSGGNCSVEPGKVSISLVPYAEQVVAGADLLGAINDSTLTRYSVTNEHASSNCVTFDYADFDTPLLSVADEIKRTGHFDPWNDASASPSRWTCVADSKDNWRILRPFVGHHSDLNYLINNLRSGGNTSIDIGMKWGVGLLDPDLRPVISDLADPARTGGAISVDPEFTDRPYDYDSKQSMKVIVLMTDGVNTDQHYLKTPYRYGDSPIWRNSDLADRYSIYNETTGKYYYPYNSTWNDFPFGDDDGREVTVENTKCTGSKWWRGRQCTTTFETTVVDQPGYAIQMTYPEVWETFTTEWYAQWSWLEDPVLSNGNAEKNTRLLNICDAAKAEGVVIYTIGFEVTSDANGVMRQCATTAGHYFNANGWNIADTFTIIANSINKLRLTQ